MTQEIQLRYEPRGPHHMRIHEMMAEHRFNVAVCHRRFGKTVLAINALINAALATPNGRYFYAAPLLKQAKKVAWQLLKEYCEGVPKVEFLASELTVKFPNGAEIALHSGEQHDAMRGQGFDGGVLDELGDFPFESWGGSIRPTLSDRNGWALFIGTPKGIDLFHELYQRGLDPEFKEWASILLPATETGVISHAEMESARRDATTPAQYEREFLCSFEASTDDVLIPLPNVLGAMKRTLGPTGMQGLKVAPKIIGVDPAGEGKDKTVFVVRHGDAVLKIETLTNTDAMFVVGRLRQLVKDQSVQRDDGVDAIFVDSTGGYGAGVISRWQQLGYEEDIFGVNFSSAAINDEAYANKRAEMWAKTALWLKQGTAVLPDVKLLLRDLTAVRYKYDSRNRLQLERKDELRKRLGASPDIGDALALTFAADVERKTHDPDIRMFEENILRREMARNGYGNGSSYDVYGDF